MDLLAIDPMMTDQFTALDAPVQAQVIPFDTATATVPVPAPATGSKIPTWVWVAGGVGVIALMQPKRKVSGPFRWESLIVPGAVIIGGYLVLSKLGLFGSKDNEQNNQAVAAQTQQADQAALQQSGNPTISTANAAAIADDIFLQATSSVFSNTVDRTAQDKIVQDIVGNVQNQADWFLIKVAYGSRKIATSPFSTCAVLGYNCQVFNLDATIKMAVDQDHVNDIHDFLISKGINYNF